jgi:hypothetical protein
MFTAIKKMLGIEKPLVLEEPVVEQSTTTTAKEKIEKAKSTTKPVTVKAKAEAASKPKRETRKSLEKMTKVQIDELAAELFGAQLDRRKTKTDMIEAFMDAQKKAK